MGVYSIYKNIKIFQMPKSMPTKLNFHFFCTIETKNSNLKHIKVINTKIYMKIQFQTIKNV